jgi:site-specific DNA-methyltransferase (adenine-specific)
MRVYYRDEWVTLYHGDCREVLPTLPAVDLVLTDPPYSVVTHDGARTRTDGANSDSLVTFAAFDGEKFLSFARDALRISKGWVVTFCDWRHAALLEPAQLHLIRLGVWVKPNSAPQLTGDRPAHGWEAIAILHNPGAKSWNGGGERGVWTYNRVDAVLHPTQKPLPLMTRLAKLFSNEGDTILDPYCGSGTTLRGAKDAGRRAIGIEIDERYCEITANRLAQGILEYAESP